LKFNRRFGGIFRLRIEGRKIIQARYQHEADKKQILLFLAAFLLGLFFDPEDGGDM
jgi:hypothetical protein